MGGKLVRKTDDSVAVVLSPLEEVTKSGKMMEEAKTLGIQIVPEIVLSRIPSTVLRRWLKKSRKWI
jgi:hypothetical protein